MAEATPTSIDLITAAFSSMLGVDVVPLHKVPESAVAHSKKVSIHDLFTATHYIGGMQSGVLPQALEVAGQEFGINVRSFTGTRNHHCTCHPKPHHCSNQGICTKGDWYSNY